MPETGGDSLVALSLAAGNQQVALGAFAGMSFAKNLGGGALADEFTPLGGPGFPVLVQPDCYGLNVSDDGVVPIPGPTAIALPGAGQAWRESLQRRNHTNQKGVTMRFGRKMAIVGAAGLGALALLVAGARETVSQIQAALVRDMDGVARGERFTAFEQFNYYNNDTGGSETINLDIPVGKKLILQTVSVACFVPTGQTPIGVRVRIANPAPEFRLWVDLDLQGTSNLGQRMFAGNLPLNMVVMPGEAIDFRFFRGPERTGLAVVDVSLVGYLVDAAR